MKIYDGYQGKHVKKRKNFRLQKKNGGKRLLSEPIKEDFFNQTIQLLIGKIKCCFTWLKEYFIEDEYPEEIEQEEAYLEDSFPYVGGYFEPKIISGEDYEPIVDDTLSILTMEAASLSRVSDVIEYVKEGKAVIVNYQLLNGEFRRRFDFLLSKELMLLGTHLIHINDTQIICANRHIVLDDRITAKHEGKIYDLAVYRRR